MKSRDAVVLSADVFGYTRLVNDFEAKTLERLVLYHKIFGKYVGRAGGRIFNYAGDAVLAEFPEIDAALIAAVKIQQQISRHNLICPLGQRMLFRMGINAGKVFERGADLLGDTVNIAARLQAVAQPGGICVSEGIYLGMSQGLDIPADDIGPQSLKNIPASVQAYTLSFNQGSLPRRLVIPTALVFACRHTKVLAACAALIALVRVVAFHDVKVDHIGNGALPSVAMAAGAATPSGPVDKAPLKPDVPISVLPPSIPVPAASGLGSASGPNATPADAAPTIPDAKSLPVSRCKLVIAQQTVIDTAECDYEATSKYMTFAAPSTNGRLKYVAKVNLKPDRTGDGFLSGGTTPQERSLGTMTRSGACWINVDKSVQLCAWK